MATHSVLPSGRCYLYFKEGVIQAGSNKGVRKVPTAVLYSEDGKTFLSLYLESGIVVPVAYEEMPQEYYVPTTKKKNFLAHIKRAWESIKNSEFFLNSIFPNLLEEADMLTKNMSQHLKKPKDRMRPDGRDREKVKFSHAAKGHVPDSGRNVPSVVTGGQQTAPVVVPDDETAERKGIDELRDLIRHLRLEAGSLRKRRDEARTSGRWNQLDADMQNRQQALSTAERELRNMSPKDPVLFESVPVYIGSKDTGEGLCDPYLNDGLGVLSGRVDRLIAEIRLLHAELDRQVMKRSYRHPDGSLDDKALCDFIAKMERLKTLFGKWKSITDLLSRGSDEDSND